MSTIYKISCIAFIGLFLASMTVFGQGSIKGTITDEDTGESLPGVSIVITSLNLGTITGLDGTYTLSNVPAGEQKVTISYVGYKTITQTVTVNDGSDATLDAVMGEVATELDEVIVTGTGGPVEKRKIGNSVGSISSKQYEDMPVNSISDILTGREPGLQALQGGGMVGEGTQIRIRGSASLSQLNEPIVIIDGVRVDNGGGFGSNQGALVSAGGGGTSRLDDINPDAIERIEILKGAAAATLYGTEASNGVIQIFTKQGSKGKAQFSFQTTQGWITFPKKYPNNTGFARNAAQASTVSGVLGQTYSPYELIQISAMHDLFETGRTQSYSLSARGGNNNISYFFSGRILDQDGPFGGKDRNYPSPDIFTRAEDLNQRSNFNMNLGITPVDKVKINLSAGYSNTDLKTTVSNNNIYAVGSLAQFSKPERITPNNHTGTAAFSTVNEALQNYVTQDVKHFNGSVNVNYSPLKWLIVDGTVGVDFSNSKGEAIVPFGYNIDGFANRNVGGELDFAIRNFQAVSWELKASATHTLSPVLESDFIIGTQLIRQEEVIDSGEGIDFPGDGFQIPSAGNNQRLFNFFQESINAGIFAQEQIGYKDQLFLTIGARLDAHSAFGSNFNAAFYPKVAVSWVLSDTPWWGDGYGPLSSLQLKAAWGQSGLQPGAFDALTTYEAIASSNGPGIAPLNIGNADLEPEIASEFEIGTSFGLFKDKLSVEFTYWDRTISQAMFNNQFVLSGGFRRQQLINIGEVKANGLEISVSGAVYKSGDWEVDLFANTAFLKETITDLGGSPPIKVGASYPRYRNFLIEGEAPGANFGAKLLEVGPNELPIDIVDGGDGLPDSREELITYLASLTTPGLPTNAGEGGVLLADEDGDGDLLDHPLGKNTPDWSGSFGGTIRWKNFSLKTNFEYRGGDYWINNLTGAFRQANPGIGRNLPTSARVERDYMTGGVDANFNPQNSGEVRLEALEKWLYENLALAPFSGLNTIERGDYVRWRELSLSYRVPNSIVEKWGFNNVSITAAGRNIALFTKYSGVDPEINVFGRGVSNGGGNADQNFGQGIEAFGYAIPRQIIFTLKAGF